MSDLKTPDEWCVELGIEILDPDGWRGANGRPWTDPITRKEFGSRSIVSTQRRVTPADRAQMQANRTAGLRARHETREARAVRRQVAEEIADAIEAMRRKPVTISEAMRRSPADYLASAAEIARQIGAEEAPND